MRTVPIALICLAWFLTPSATRAQPPHPHPWLPPYGLERVGYLPEGADSRQAPPFEADAVARPCEVVNPVDLGAILPPADWLLLGPGQTAEVAVAAISREVDAPAARLRVWFDSRPDDALTVEFPLRRDRRATKTLSLTPPPLEIEQDLLHVAIQQADGTEVWSKAIPVMLVAQPPAWPEFGATETLLRYDAPISVREEDGTFSQLSYDTAWDDALRDVVVSLSGGARFVFWRGSSYIPFWAGRHNTGLCYEWAETSPPADGFTDCVEPLMDKLLRYGRVEIVESTPARVHVRWTYQSCDFLYKVWGDSAVEDFYFYPDGFGSRVLTLQSDPAGDYELSEFIVLTPQGAYPLQVLPPNLVDVLFLDGEKREIAFPYRASEQGEKLTSRGQPAVYRVRLHRDEEATAVYFHPTETELPPVVFAAFEDQGQVVTPAYWGSHWPLSRGQTTGGAIDDRIYASPAHNSLMTWARQRPQPLREATMPTLDTLGRARAMRVQTWAWMIGLSSESDERLLEHARSFAAPPSIALTGARLDAEPAAPERRAVRLVAEAPVIDVTLTPEAVTVNPVLEIRRAPRGRLFVRLNGETLPDERFAWDGGTLWLEATLREPTRIELRFGE